MPKNYKVTLQEGTSKKTGKPYAALKVNIGMVEKVYFDLTPLEVEHIKEILAQSNELDLENED